MEEGSMYIKFDGNGNPIGSTENGYYNKLMALDIYQNGKKVAAEDHVHPASKVTMESWEILAKLLEICDKGDFDVNSTDLFKLKSKTDFSTELSMKADLINGLVPDAQLPSLISKFNNIFEVVNEGQADEYVYFKMPLASVGNIKAGIQGGSFSPSIWDGLPTASASVKGGVKIGNGLLMTDGVLSAVATGGGAWGEITGTLADQLDLIAALNGKASSSHNNSQHSEAYITAAALTPYATNARVDGIEALMSTDTERTNAVNQVIASYTAADNTLNGTITEALVTKAPKDSPVFTGILRIESSSDQILVRQFTSANKYWRLGTDIGSSGANKNFTLYGDDLGNVLTVDQATGNIALMAAIKAVSFKTTDFELVQSGTNCLLKYQGTTIIKISSAGKIEAGDNVRGGVVGL